MKKNMSRKKRKTSKYDHDTGRDNETAAVINLLAVAWRLAAQHGVCPICLMNEAVNTMDTAERRGFIQHGIEEPASLPYGETLQ